MATTSAKSFLRLLEKSGLVPAERLTPALRELKISAAGAVVNLDQLAGHLIDRGLITQWQRDKLAAGKYKGFFVGKYKLLGLLGTGGMSTVYLAEHTVSGQRRAIKVLPRKKVANRSYLDRFYREGRASAALNHPNIVRVYDIAGKDTTHYMVMEFVEGTDLYELVKQIGPVEFDLTVKYVLQAAIGLQHAHERKLVHRDIKPANLLVSPSGTVKILDLGLALLKSDEEESLTIMHNERVMGTADYLAPEQAINSHNVDLRADIYSLGCTLYYLLTGHPPFPEGTLAQRIVAHQTREPEDIRKSRPDCPKRLVQICQKMMRKQPSERFQHCGQLMMALDAYRIPEHHTDAEFDSFVAVQSSNLPIECNRITEQLIDDSTPTHCDKPPETNPAKKTNRLGKRRPFLRSSKNGHKPVPLGMIVSIATLLLLTVALGLVWMTNFFGASDETASRISDPDLRDRTTAASVKNSDDSSSNKTVAGSRNTSAASQRLPVFSAGDVDSADQPEQSLTTIKFEADEGFRNNMQEWPVFANNVQTGTLRGYGDCELFQEPYRGQKCLLVFGNTDKVEFRPVRQDSQLKEIRFFARRQNQDEPFSFKVQVKSLNQREKWQTVLDFDDRIDPLNSTEYSEIAITDKELGLLNAQKFRFKLEGKHQNGILIDDLQVTFQR